MIDKAAATLLSFGVSATVTRLVIKDKVEYNGRTAEQLMQIVKEIRARYPYALKASLVATLLLSQFSLLLGGAGAAAIGVVRGVIHEVDRHEDQRNIFQTLNNLNLYRL